MMSEHRSARSPARSAMGIIGPLAPKVTAASISEHRSGAEARSAMGIIGPLAPKVTAA